MPTYVPLPPRRDFLRRLARHFGMGVLVLTVSLGLGVIGYHLVAELPWIDALLNAAMILGGEGPVNPMVTPSAKLFAAFYAMFSGVVFISVASILIAPVAHRLIHKFHIENRRD